MKWPLVLILLVATGCGSSAEHEAESGSTVSSEVVRAPAADVVAPAPTADRETARAAHPQVDPVATALRGTPIYPHAVRSVAISADGSLVAAGTGDGQVRLWDVRSKELRHTIPAHREWAFDLFFAPDGSLLSGGGDDQIRVIDPAKGIVSGMYADHAADLHGVVVTPNGEWLVSGGDDARVLVRSLKTGEVKSIGKHEAQVTAIAVSPDGRYAASASRDRTAILWDLEKQIRLRDFRGHTADVMSVSFSADGRQLATGSYDKTARVWDVETGEELRSFDAHTDWVFAALFTRDGQSLFTGCGDGFLRLFRIDDGRVVFESKLFSEVSDLALSPDGTLLAAGTAGGGVRLFRVDANSAVRWHEELVISDQPRPEKETIPELPVDDYLSSHSRILTVSEDWGPAVAAIAPYGDAFTLHLLRRVDETKLRPDQAELRRRVMQQIEGRRGAEAERIKVGEVASMLQRAAAADLQCHALEGSLTPWVLERLQDQSTAPVFRRMLEKYRESPPVAPEDAKQPLGDLSDRICEYLDGILKSSSSEEPPAPPVAEPVE